MGEIKKQGISNAIISYIGIAIGFINLLVLQPILLSPEEIGLTRILFSFSSLLATLIPLGMINVIIRFFPVFENKEKKNFGFFGFSLLIPGIGFLIVGSLMYLCKDYFISKYNNQSPLFAEYFNYVFPLSFFLAFTSVLGSYCAVLFKTPFPSFVNDIASRILNVLVFSLYFLKVININTMILSFVGIYFLQMITLLIYIVIIDKPSVKIDFNYFREKKVFVIIQYGLLFSIGVMSSIGLRYLDSVIIGIYLPLSAVGVYSICAFIPTVIEVPLSAIEKISNPKIAKYWEENNIIEIEKIYNQSVKYLSLVGSYIFLLIVINIESLLKYLPNDFHEAHNIVKVISIGALVNISTGVNTSIIFFSKKYKMGLIFLMVLFISTLTLDIILIPKIGVIGAAIATALAAILYNALKFIYLKLMFKLNPIKKTNLILLGIVLVCYFSNSFFPFEIKSLLIDMIVKTTLISIVFCLSLLYFKVILISDVNLFCKKIWRIKIK